MKNLSVRWWMRKGIGSMSRELCRFGSGGTSGVVTDDSETFRLDNLESKVDGGAFGAPDRGAVK